jgi:hypothetical protein
MELAAGVCFESATREPKAFFEASASCGFDDRRLPAQSELIAIHAHEFSDAPTPEWAEPLFTDGENLQASLISATASVATLVHVPASQSHPYRCVVGGSN